LATYPNQTACVLIRNTSATDTLDQFPYNTKDFKDLPTNKYMFFRTPVCTYLTVKINHWTDHPCRTIFEIPILAMETA
jgi:hypothetical protein